jgi:hypothetical protein
MGHWLTHVDVLVNCRQIHDELDDVTVFENKGILICRYDLLQRIAQFTPYTSYSNIFRLTYVAIFTKYTQRSCLVKNI